MGRLFKVTLNSDFPVYTQVFGINLFVLIRTTSWAILDVVLLVAVLVTHCCLPQTRNLAESVFYSILVLNQSMLGFFFLNNFFRDCYLIIFEMCSNSSFFKLCQKKCHLIFPDRPIYGTLGTRGWGFSTFIAYQGLLSFKAKPFEMEVCALVTFLGYIQTEERLYRNNYDTVQESNMAARNRMYLELSTLPIYLSFLMR